MLHEQRNVTGRGTKKKRMKGFRHSDPEKRVKKGRTLVSKLSCIFQLTDLRKFIFIVRWSLFDSQLKNDGRFFVFVSRVKTVQK